ncbi:MAG: precorrin methylase [Salinarimonadaceae bacterium]|nr:MAG: precorrin methylase [Salinarimonadaceae bacterium]
MIAAGFGFRKGASVTSLMDALSAAAGGRPVSVLATAADKAQTGVFRSLAAEARLPVRGVDAGSLAAQRTRTHSQASLEARDVGSLAEAAALAAAGEGARLLAPRTISGDGMATCALAEGNGP